MQTRRVGALAFRPFVRNIRLDTKKRSRLTPTFFIGSTYYMVCKVRAEVIILELNGQQQLVRVGRKVVGLTQVQIIRVTETEVGPLNS